MTGIDELRATLRTHADDTIGREQDHVSRVGGVRQRVAVVRRRRRVAAASTLAAVVAVSGVVALRPDDSPPEPASVVGVTPPETMTALGYVYERDELVDGRDGSVRVQLEASDRPRLVSWATSGDDQHVTVDGFGSDGLTSSVDDLTDWVYVAPGSSGAVRVDARDGDPGLAVYALSPTAPRPLGYTKDGVTYRDEVAGARLIDAAVGDVGQGRLQLDAPESEAATLVLFCSGAPRGAWVTAVGSDGSVAGSECGADGAPVDAAAASSSWSLGVADLVDPVILTVTASFEDPTPVTQPGMRLGAALYTDPTPGSSRADEPLVEDGGHLWRRVERRDAQPGTSRLATQAPDGEGPYLFWAGSSAPGTLAVGIGDERVSGPMIGGGGETSTTVDAGEQVTLRLRGGRASTERGFWIVYYERAD